MSKSTPLCLGLAILQLICSSTAQGEPLATYELYTLSIMTDSISDGYELIVYNPSDVHVTCYESSSGGGGGEECSPALLLASTQSYSDCCAVKEGQNSTRRYILDQQQQCTTCGKSGRGRVQMTAAGKLLLYIGAETSVHDVQ